MFIAGLLFSFKKNNKWGYLDINGNVIIEPYFDFSDTFYNGLAPIKLGKKWGILKIPECIRR